MFRNLPSLISATLLYSGLCHVNSKNGIAFYQLADVLLIEDLISPLREYVMKHVDNDTLMRTWSDDSFKERCIDFVNSSEFDSDMALKNVGSLEPKKCIEFLQEVGEYLPSSVLNSLRKNWLKENPCGYGVPNEWFEIKNFKSLKSTGDSAYSDSSYSFAEVSAFEGIGRTSTRSATAWKTKKK